MIDVCPVIRGSDGEGCTSAMKDILAVDTHFGEVSDVALDISETFVEIRQLSLPISGFTIYVGIISLHNVTQLLGCVNIKIK